MECKPSGSLGRGMAYYYDPKTVGIANFFFNPQNPKFLGFPVSFPGFGTVSTFPARIQSDWYLYGIPTPFTKIGVCNHLET
jgi:hypothetical protein